MLPDVRLRVAQLRKRDVPVRRVALGLQQRRALLQLELELVQFQSSARQRLRRVKREVYVKLARGCVAVSNR